MSATNPYPPNTYPWKLYENIHGGGGVALELSGQSLGQSAIISDGTAILIGGTNVTLSQSSNSITFIAGGGGGGGQAFTAGVSSGGNTSGTTGLATGQLVFVGGNNITLSQSIDAFLGSATITISAFNQVVQSIQTQNLIDLSLSGNTSGTLALVSSGTAIFAGGNNITLSQQGQSVTISGPNTQAQTVQTQNLVSINGSTGNISLVAGNNITLSQNASTITVSAFNQSVQPIGTNTAGVSNLGNTAGTSGTINGTGIQLILAGGNNVTLSQSLNGSSATITISVANQSVQPEGTITAGISNLGNTSGTSGVISGTGIQVILAGGNNITLSQSVNGSSATITISAPNAVAQTNQTLGLIASSQTTGQSSSTTVDARSLSIVGQGIVSIGMSAGSLLISATTVAQSVQTQNLIDVSLSGNTSGTLALVSSGTLILAGGNNITLSQNGQSVTISAGNAAAGGGVSSAGISNIGNTSGTTGLVDSRIVLAGGNNVTLSGSNDAANHSATITISVANQTVQTQNLIDLSLSGNTTGTLALVSSGTAILAGGNNITLSQNGQSITISGANTVAQSVQTQNLIDVSLSGNTTGTLALVSSGTLILAGGNNITLSQNGQSVTISAASQSVQAEGTQTIGMSNIGNTSGNTSAVTGTGIQVIFAGGNNITLSQSTNGSSATITISAFNQTVQTQNLFDLTLSGNTTGTLALISSGTLTLAGGNNITLSQVGNAVTISAPNLAGGAGLNAGLSTIGNTAGNTGLVNASLVFAGGNNITLSGSTNGQSETITISAFNQTQESQTFGISNLGNTSGTSGVISGPQVQMIIAGGNNVTLSQSTNGSSATVTISGPASAIAPSISVWQNIGIAGETGTSAALGSIVTSNGTLWLFPIHDPTDVFPGNMTVNTLLLDMSGSGSSNTSGAHSYTVSVGFYTLQDASNLALAHSGSTSWSMSANANNSGSYQGPRWLSIHSSKFNVAPTFSNTSYWMGLWMRSSSVAYSLGFLGINWNSSVNRSGFLASASASNQSVPWYPFHGIFSVSFTTAMPGTINRTDMSYASFQGVPRVVFNNLAGMFA